MEQVNANEQMVQAPVETSQTPVVAKKTSSIVIILLFTAILVLSGVGFYVSGETKTPVPSPSVPPIENPKMTVNQASSSLVFYNNGELWEREEGVLEQLTNTGSAVSNYSVNADTTQIAYIVGDVEKNQNGYDMITPKAVFLKNMKNGQVEKIHSLEPKFIDGNTEYRRTLIAVDFSPSGKKLAITASNALWIYDIQTKQLNEIFFNEENPSRGMVYSYANPIFSKDESEMVLGVGHYEGSSQMYVNLNTKETKELPLSAYVQGKRIFEHDEDAYWLMLEWGSSIDGEPWTKISSINLNTNEEKIIKSIDNVSSTVIIKTQDQYVLSGLTYWEKANEEGIVFSGNDQRLMSWDRKSGELKTLLDTPQNSEDGKKSSSISSIKPVGSSSNDFYVSITDNMYGAGSHNEYRIQKYDAKTGEFETVEYNASLFVYR